MNFKKVYVLLLSFSFVLQVIAQSVPDIGELLESNDIESSAEGYDEMVNTLLELYASPLNINTADFDSLKRIFFLSDGQIDQILGYRKKYGGFFHVNVLLWVPGDGKRD